MERRVVSYSDLDADLEVASTASTSKLAPSSHVQVESSLTGASTDSGLTKNENKGNGKGKRKRKGGNFRRASSLKSGRLASVEETTRSKTSAARGGVHWDDPDYLATEPSFDSKDWRQEYTDRITIQGTNDELQETPQSSAASDTRPELMEEFFDAYSDSHLGSSPDSDSGHSEISLEAADTNVTSQVEYTDWKYDENGDRYTTHTQSDRSDDEHRGEEEDEYGLEECVADGDPMDSDLASDDDGDGSSTHAGFLIPDLDEFKRSWRAKHEGILTNGSSAAIYPADPRSIQDHHHRTRPPKEVGGGGRVLTHSEIWGPAAITDAWAAAMQQFSSMHGLSPDSVIPNNTLTSSTEVAVCYDGTARASSSKVQENSPEQAMSHASPLWSDAPGFDSLLAKQIQLDTQQILLLQSQQKKERILPTSTLNLAPSKPLLNTAEDADLSSAVTAPSKARNDQSHSGTATATCKTHVPSSHLPGNHAWKRAVKTVRNTPNRISIATVDKSVNSGKEEVSQALLHQYWYAGYYAGIAQSQAQHAATETMVSRPDLD